ncbi:VOC family protein [Arthrobacter sp. JCM 19049]|uniref:VOC family protein n=1 Tax=Arthrobacter sp. JCM 19049 TaxID=1460643 RepID=UPI0035B50B81
MSSVPVRVGGGRYGVSWQLTLAVQGETVPQFLTPCLMFCGPAQNQAAEAADFYVATFSDSKPGQRFHYPRPIRRSPRSR